MYSECMYVCLYVYLCMYVLCVHVCMFICMCMYVCTYVYFNVYIYMFLCVFYVCMYVSVYVCMYYICIIYLTACPITISNTPCSAYSFTIVFIITLKNCVRYICFYLYICGVQSILVCFALYHICI